MESNSIPESVHHHQGKKAVQKNVKITISKPFLTILPFSLFSCTEYEIPELVHLRQGEQ